MSERQFRVKVRAARFKGGGEVRLLPSKRRAAHAEVVAAMREAVQWADDNHEQGLVGHVLVTWDADGMSAIDIVMKDASRLSSFQLPDFVAERVRRELSERDAVRATKQLLGITDTKD